MLFHKTHIGGVFLIEPERLEDPRGFFARTWCQREFEAHGLSPQMVQCSVSYNRKRGTLRGLHYQIPPHVEAKLVRCTRGSLLDVVIDLRPDSPTFKQHVAVLLSAENHLMLYIPEQLAHGFQTLEDHTEVFYQMSEFYAPEHTRGVRYNDPAFGIRWPVSELIILERDAAYPDFEPDGDQ